MPQLCAKARGRHWKCASGRPLPAVTEPRQPHHPRTPQKQQKSVPHRFLLFLGGAWVVRLSGFGDCWQWSAASALPVTTTSFRTKLRHWVASTSRSDGSVEAFGAWRKACRTLTRGRVSWPCAIAWRTVKPLVELGLNLVRPDRNRANTPTAVCLPRPTAPWIEADALEQTPRVLRIRGGEVTNLLADSSADHAIGRIAFGARLGTRHVQTSKGHILNGGLPGGNRDDHNRAVDGDFFGASSPVACAGPAVNRDQVVAMDDRASEILSSSC